MTEFQNYDNTYEKALKTNDPIEFIEKKWGSAEPYYNEFIAPVIGNLVNINVVEVGAGFGRYTKIAEHKTNIIYAIEPSVLCRDFLTKNFEKVKSLDTNELDQIPNNIDLVYSFSCMLHFNLYEIWFYMKNLSEKLKKGGNMILHYSSFESGGLKIFKKQVGDNFGDNGRYCFHHSTQLLALANELKLKFMGDKTPKNQIVPGHRVIRFIKK